MRNLYKFFVVLGFFLSVPSCYLFAQVGINADNSSPDSSAMLDVKSSNMGLLLPRLSDDARNSIPSPSTGLVIYNTSTNLLNYFNGNQWFQLESSISSSTTGLLKPGGGVSINATPGTPPDSSAMLDINDSSRGVLIPRTIPDSIAVPARGLILYNNSTDLINYYNGNTWRALCATSTGTSGGTGNQNALGVSINSDGSSIHPSAILDVSANRKGILIPRLTESQRNALMPVTGLTIYNLDSDEIEFYNCTNWCKLIVSFLPAPTEGTHVPALTQIIWNWNPVTGATGYKWNTTDDYSTAVNMGSSTSKTESGLTCNTSYIRYVWAYNSCSLSTVTSLSKTTTDCCSYCTSSANNATYIWISNLKFNTINNTSAGVTGYQDFTSISTTVSPGAIYNLSITCGSTGSWSDHFWCFIDWNQDCDFTDTGESYDLGYVNGPGTLTLNITIPLGATLGSTRLRASLKYLSDNPNSCATFDYGQVEDYTIVVANCNLPPQLPTEGTHTAYLNQIVWNWNPVAGAVGYKWNTTDDYSTAVDMGSSTSKTESGLTCNTSYRRYVWAYNSCGHSGTTTLSKTTLTIVAPTSGTHVSSLTQIIWNWNLVTGATGYKWGTTNNYALATDMGTATTYTETGLTCNTSYTRYAWAYSPCGNSTAVTLTKSTLINPPAPTSGTNVSFLTQIIWNWNIVSGATGYKWNTTNSYITATDMGAVTTKTETELTSCTVYSRYIWAYNPCGNSTSVILTDTTRGIPPSGPIAGTHVPSPGQIIWNWNPVSGATGYKWNTSNSYVSATNLGTAVTKTETGLTPNTTYTRYVWAYNICENSVATTLIQATSACPVWICGQSFTDSRDGKIYNTVQINAPLGPQFGKQCWMKENLNIGSRIDGYVEQTNNGVIEKYCYENSTANCNIYGGLYEWDELMKYNTSLDSIAFGKKWGICPTGWHVPTDADWTQLSTWLGGDVVAGGKMKEAGTGHWWIPNSGASNSSGFTGLPGGWRINSGTGPQDSVFEDQYQNGYFWSSSFSALPDVNFSWARYLHYSNEYVYRTGNHHTMGLSVRCIKDIGPSGSFSCGDSIIINHVADTVAPVTKTVTYGTVIDIPGEACKCWITQNLGADHQASSVDDDTEASAGWYWQFNRKQGYKHDGTTRTPNTTWINNIYEQSDWITANDPCNIELDTTWRLPTFTEYYNVDNTGGWTTWTGPWGSGLKLHAAGKLQYSNGSLVDRGYFGNYWSSSNIWLADNSGWYLGFYHDGSDFYDIGAKADGFSVRCVRDF